MQENCFSHSQYGLPFNLRDCPRDDANAKYFSPPTAENSPFIHHAGPILIDGFYWKTNEAASFSPHRYGLEQIDSNCQLRGLLQHIVVLAEAFYSYYPQQNKQYEPRLFQRDSTLVKSQAEAQSLIKDILQLIEDEESLPSSSKQTIRMELQNNPENAIIFSCFFSIACQAHLHKLIFLIFKAIEIRNQLHARCLAFDEDQIVLYLKSELQSLSNELDSLRIELFSRHPEDDGKIFEQMLHKVLYTCIASLSGFLQNRYFDKSSNDDPEQFLVHHGLENLLTDSASIQRQQPKKKKIITKRKRNSDQKRMLANKKYNIHGQL